jgi:hypothetical protein
MKNKIDIQSELENAKNRNIEFHQNKLIQEAYALINSKTIGENYNNKEFAYVDAHSETEIAPPIQIKNTKLIFALADIKKVSIANRLKFVDLHFHKPKLPNKAKLKYHAFKIEHGENFKFKILSHSDNFRSNKYNYQKLLFAEIGKNEYFLIYKWGQPLTRVNKLLNLPLRNLENMLAFVFGLALVITLITPTNLLTNDKNIGYFSFYRAFYFFWCSIAASSIMIYYSVSIRKGLNSESWSNPSIY